MLFVKEYTPHPLKKTLRRLRQHRGLNDLLTYRLPLNDNTILHKDGAISRHFIYVTPDMESSTDHLLDHHAQTWSQAFQFLGDGWMVETNVLSQSLQTTESTRTYPESVSALIADERRFQFQYDAYYQNTYYLSISYHPPRHDVSRFKRFAVEGEAKQDRSFDNNVAFFNKTVSEFIGYLRRSLVSIRPLEKDELTTFLHQCLTGNNQTLAQPLPGMCLDSYIASQDFIAGFHPQIGTQHIACLAIDGLPPHSYPTLCERLSFFSVNYRWSNRFVCLDTQTASTYLKRYERSWSSKAIGLLGVIRESLGMPAKRDEDAQGMADDIKVAQVDNSSGAQHFGFYNSTLIIMHEDKKQLDTIVEELVTHIQQMDFRVRVETVNATESYLGTLPSHGGYNLRKMMVDTQFIGHAFPISSVYQGEPKAPCNKVGYKDEPSLLLTATQGARSFHLNLHVGDVGHTAILGPTGQGKSTLVALMMAAHRKYPGSRVVVLDKDRSHRIAIKALGGDYIDMKTDDCQLGVLSRLHPDKPETLEEAVNWLSDVCQVQGVLMTPLRQSVLRDSVTRLSQEEAQYKTLNHLSIQDPDCREAINSFNSGRFQQLLNGIKPNLLTSDVVGIEMSELLKSQHNSNDKNIPVIKAILNELQSAFADKRPTLLILEEAWAFLRHPLLQRQLTDWFKTLRKANVAALFISQDLDDIVKSDAASTIQTSCMTRIYLPNPSAKEPAVSEQYRAFGLNEQQINLLYQATPKQDYYYQSPLGERLFRLDIKALATTFLCVAEPQDIKQFNACYDKDNPAWILDWLRLKGLADWEDFAKAHYFQGELS